MSKLSLKKERHSVVKSHVKPTRIKFGATIRCNAFSARFRNVGLFLSSVNLIGCREKVFHLTSLYMHIDKTSSLNHINQINQGASAACMAQTVAMDRIAQQYLNIGLAPVSKRWPAKLKDCSTFSTPPWPPCCSKTSL